MSTHTKGPWSSDNFGMKVFATKSPYGHGPMNVADVRGWGHLTGSGACRFDEKKATAIQYANARLIAAAPAYWDAAEILSTDCSELDGDDAGYVAVQKDAFDALMNAHKSASGSPEGGR